LRKLARNEARFQKDVNHQISKKLVTKATHARKALAIEDLTGIRERTTVRRAERRQRASWAFHQLRSFLAYKAQRAGVPVCVVDPRNTSRTCSACGHCDKANRKTHDRFLCGACGYQANADINAAVNISRAAVNQPTVSAPSVGAGYKPTRLGGIIDTLAFLTALSCVALCHHLARISRQ
jgi:IS605 OrfB family transposase